MKSNANGLMGDLESIKALLEEEDDLLSDPSWDIAMEPVQEVSVPEPPILTTKAPEPTPELTEETVQEPLQEPAPTTDAAALDALLGTEFQDAATKVMARARGLIEQHPNKWSPQQTDELSDALRVRIDGAVKEWISVSLAAHAGELQQRLLNAVRDELARHLEAFETDSSQP